MLGVYVRVQRLRLQLVSLEVLELVSYVRLAGKYTAVAASRPSLVPTLREYLIEHFMKFDGQFIVSDSDGRSYALQLAPQHGLRKEEGRLVVCGDMLLILSFSEFHRPDMSTEPATWVDLTR